MWNVSFLAALATILGGALSMRFAKHVQLVTALSSGLLVGASFFDLLPEGLRHALHEGASAQELQGAIATVAFGFFGFYLLDLLLPERHEAGHEDHKHAPLEPRAMGVIGALLIVLHSALDGALLSALSLAGADGVGSDGVHHHGSGVALALHRFVDGLTLVSMMVRNSQPRQRTWYLLVAVCLAPLVGAWVFSAASWLGSHVAELTCVFAGAFLYLGGSHLPSREHDDSRRFAPLVTALGFAAVFILSR